MKKIAYLCGGINGLNDSQCRDWREYIKSSLNEQFDFLDPMRRDYRGIEIENLDNIVNGDKKDILDSDFLITYAERPSWGTAMEVIYAWENQRIVYSICSAEKPSPWLIYHSTKIFKTIEDLIDYLKCK